MNQKNLEELYNEALIENERLRKEIDGLRQGNKKHNSNEDNKELALRPEEIKPGMKVFYKGINKQIVIDTVTSHGSIKARVLSKDGLFVNHYVLIPGCLNDGTTLFKI